MTPITLAQILEGCGHLSYLPQFNYHAISLKQLPSLSSEDLKEIGIEKLGHRKEILATIKAVFEQANSANTPQKYFSSVAGVVLIEGGVLPLASEFSGESVDTFYLGKTVVTWAEWKAVRAWAINQGYKYLANVGRGMGDNCPVTDVSWKDAIVWCNARSEKEGKMPFYRTGGRMAVLRGEESHNVDKSANGYRLPTGEEWEFAARGGRYSKGCMYSGSNNLGDVGWYHKNSDEKAPEVGKKQPNELGIFDMSGGVFEWCNSWFYSGPSDLPMMRGGSWQSRDEDCDVSYLGFVEGETGYPMDVLLSESEDDPCFGRFGRYDCVGFRVARNAAP